jgi:SOS-response transcriptional repressor LexA
VSWATYAIEKLKQGETVQIRPKGHSMVGKVNSGDLVTIEPISNHTVQKGDIVLCKVKGNQYLHLIVAMQNNRYLIGNNHGRINGWIGSNNLYGKAVKIEK